MLTSTCSFDHVSRVTLFLHRVSGFSWLIGTSSSMPKTHTLDMCEPNFRCAVAHCTQMNIPIFQLVHRGAGDRQSAHVSRQGPHN